MGELSFSEYSARTTSYPPIKELNSQLYSGELLLFSDSHEMERILHMTREYLVEFFGPLEPMELHLHFDRPSLGKLADEARLGYARSTEIQSLWKEFFRSVGMQEADYACDRLILRFHPPEALDPSETTPTSIQRVPIHRDSWGSNLFAQINWWAPVFDLSPDRTFLMYPDFWSVPIANNSDSFDIHRAAKERKSGTASMKDLIPSALEEVDHSFGCPVLIAPGQIMAFSAQHAHGGIPNYSDKTRISLDTRSICIADFKNNVGARNTDGSTPREMTHIFRRLSDRKKLSEIHF